MLLSYASSFGFAQILGSCWIRLGFRVLTDSNINCFPVIFSCMYLALLANLFPLHGSIKVCNSSNNLEPGCPVRDSIPQKDYPMLPFSVKLSQLLLALSSKSLLN